MNAVNPSDFLVRLDRADLTRRGRTLLRQVSWTLAPGQHWSVTGANGAGKTTFLRLVRGDAWPDPPGSDGPPPRLYNLDGEVLDSPIGVRERVGLVGPELRDLYRRMDWDLAVPEVVASGLTDSPRLYAPASLETDAAVDQALERAGAVHLRARTFLRLSQGEAVRVLLARALVNAPLLLILDEALDGLDRASRLGLEGLWEALAASGVGLLAAAHRPEDLPGVLTHGLLLSDGAVAAQGPLREVAGLDRRRAAVRGSALESGSFPGKQPWDQFPGEAPPGSGPESAPSPAPLVEVRNVDVVLDGRIVLKDLTWGLLPGENWAVLGANGAGKSTFLKLLAADLRPAAGGGSLRHRFGGREARTLWEVRRNAGLVSFDLAAGFDPGLTALQAVATGLTGSLGVFRPLPARQKTLAARALADLGLAALSGRALGQMSNGQRRLVFICRAMVRRPRALLLDEPFGGLDRAARPAMTALLTRAAARGTQLVMVTHHLEDLPGVMNRLLVLKAGRIVRQGPFPPPGEAAHG